MSTPTGEPLISADYESAPFEAEARERSIAFDATAVASDTEAMKAALTEFIVRLMFEHGSKWETPYYLMSAAARHEAFDQILNARILSSQEKGAICR